MRKVLFALILFGTQLLTAQVDTTAIGVILEDIDQIESRFGPDSTFNWRSDYFFLTIDQRTKRTNELQQIVTRLRSLSPTNLSRQDQINRSVLLLKLENEVSQVFYKEYLMPFNAEGGFYNEGTFILSNRSFATASDYSDYILWLKAYVKYLNFNLELLKTGVEEQVMRPKVIVQNTIKLLQPWVTNVNDHPFFQPLSTLSSNLTKAEKDQILKEGRSVIEHEVIVTYKEILDFFMNTYLAESPNEEGISTIKMGKEYYEDRVRFFTTLNISPDSVFRLGKSEVKRIKARMQEVITGLEYQGDFDEFISFLRRDEQFYAGTP
ncbi:MAG: DUF885 family protein, partial [Marinoscillum sp.]